MGRDLGDFQTPQALVAAVLTRIGWNTGAWQRVLEPTCGRGNFLETLAGLIRAPREIQGIELQAEYLEETRRRLANLPKPRVQQSLAVDDEIGSAQPTSIASRICAYADVIRPPTLGETSSPSEPEISIRGTLIQANLFDLDLSTLSWQDPESPLLVVGNPPWVTNTEFGSLQSSIRPPRSNVKKTRGIDALTGGSNFDAAEAVWLKLLTELAGQSPTIALLCKTLVARNVLEHARRLSLPVAFAEVIRIDAKTWFGAAVEACLLVVRVGLAADGRKPLERVPVFADLEAAEPESYLGFARGRPIANLDAYNRHAAADGVCSLTWRQGVKHDAASVMELTPVGDGHWINKIGEHLHVEEDHVFPLLKGTDLSRRPHSVPSRAVIVTQNRIGQDTNLLEHDAPLLWAYLQRHIRMFSRRKSIVYLDRPAFAMFGIGPYAFAAYKVGVSGLHRHPVFQAIGPVRGRPVMLDDTGYFLPCESPERRAAVLAALLNGPVAIGLLKSLALPGAKRPVTKGLLQRLDLKAIFGDADSESLLDASSRDVERLAGRPARWPSRIELLLEPEEIQETRTVAIQESKRPWPSPPSITSADRS